MLRKTLKDIITEITRNPVAKLQNHNNRVLDNTQIYSRESFKINKTNPYIASYVLKKSV